MTAPLNAPPVDPSANALAVLVQLSRRAREAATPTELGFVMVNESLQLLRYRQGALWLASGTSGLGEHLATVSGLPQVSATAPYTQWLSRVCRQLQKLPAGEAVRSVQATDMGDLGDDWDQWLPPHAYWLALAHPGSSQRGGLLLASDAPWEPYELAFAAELGAGYAHALHAFAPRASLWQRASGALSSTARTRWIVLALLGILVIPVPQNVLAPAEVVPKAPFLVRASQDGVIDRILVTPNQLVQVGTPLLTLDKTALQTRNALARKALGTAQEEYRQSAQLAVTDDKSKLDMALRRGTIEEKTVELAYTAELLSRVQVVAERAGVAVFSDVNDWQGKAVAAGERILTLADPAQVELVVFVPVGERFSAENGSMVTLYPNSNPLASYEARVSQVPYSAEPARDGQLAYVLKAQFEPGTPLPRIGLSGTAKLHGSRVPLLLYALRRPLTIARQWIGW